MSKLEISIWNLRGHGAVSLHGKKLNEKLADRGLSCEIVDFDMTGSLELKGKLVRQSVKKVGIYTLGRIPIISSRDNNFWRKCYTVNGRDYLLHELNIFFLQTYRFKEKLAKLANLYREIARVSKTVVFIPRDFEISDFSSLNSCRYVTPSATVEEKLILKEIKNREYDFIYVTSLTRFVGDLGFIVRELNEKLSQNQQKLFRKLLNDEPANAQMLIDESLRPELGEKTIALINKFFDSKKILDDRIYWIKFALQQKSVVITDQNIPFWNKNDQCKVINKASYTELLNHYHNTRFNIITRSGGLSIFTERLSDSMGCGTIPLISDEDKSKLLIDKIDSVQYARELNERRELLPLLQTLNLDELSKNTYLRARNSMSYQGLANKIATCIEISIANR